MVNISEKLQNVIDEDVTKGENYYSRKFKSCYNTVRKSLVLINKAKTPTYKGGSRIQNEDGSFTITKGKMVSEAELSNKDAVEMIKEVLENALNELE